MSEVRNEGGIGIFLLGLLFFGAIVGLIFAFTYFSGIRGYLEGPSARMALTAAWGLILFGLLLAAAIVLKKEHSDFYVIIGVEGPILGLFFWIWGSIFINYSLIPRNSMSVSALLAIILGLLLGAIIFILFFLVIDFLEDKTPAIKKVVLVAWLFFFVPASLGALFGADYLAQQRNVLRDEAILSSGIEVSLNPQKGRIEIVLPLNDRDYVYRSFYVELDDGEKLSLWAKGSPGRILDANKIFVSVDDVFEGKVPEAITFITSTGKTGTFPVDVEKPAE